MEALDLFIKTAKDCSYLLLHHPLLSALGSVVLLMLMVHFYCRLTVGIYESNQDMSGKTVLITGSSAGIGKATALDLARRNARVILACRDTAKAQKVADGIRAATGNGNLVVRRLDLSSFQSVRQCAEEVLATESELHVLVNNAGIFAGDSDRSVTEDGNQLVMQSNHFGPFLFTLLLLDLLKKSSPSRIINVSSSSHNFAKLDINDLNDKVSTPIETYSNTKLATVLFTVELARRLEGTGVTVNSLHPGCVKTNIMSTSTGKIFFKSYIAINFFGKSIEEGAQTTVFLAVDPQVAKTTGKYFSDCKEEPMKGMIRADQGALVDITGENIGELAKKLFEITEAVTGVSYPEK